MQSTLALRTPRYYGQELKSRGMRITENNSRYYGLSPLRTLNLGPDGVRYGESWLYRFWHREIWGRDEERRLRHKYVLLLGTRENKKAARFFSSCKAISILTIRGHAKALKEILVH